jgi:uracil-DNA glycosylase family 4
MLPWQRSGYRQRHWRHLIRMLPPADSAEEPLEVRLRALHQEIDACRICEGEVGAGYEKILGLRRGDPAAIMIVGQGPGGNEVSRRVAFAGPAGTTLDKWLVASGANPDEPREAVYITSLIKCVAPNGQIAYARMVHNCRSLLVKQLLLLRPRVVITLGKAAYHGFAEDESRTYEDALCSLFESSDDPLIRRYPWRHLVMPWPHPSPSNNAMLTRPDIKRRLDMSFADLRPYFRST